MWKDLTLYWSNQEQLAKCDSNSVVQVVIKSGWQVGRYGNSNGVGVENDLTNPVVSLIVEL